MTVSEAILTLNANVLVACGQAGFSPATVKMIEEALDIIEDVLKMQEPRVMTLEEVKTKISDGEIAFLVEYNDIVNPVWLLIARYLNTLDEFVVVDRLGNMHNYGANGYNVDWRCWTSRPTDEQREVVKWDG